MKEIQALLELMTRLRDPQTGCPWDQEQTFCSIAPYTIEEAYEVADTIERNALDELKDELGDLLFQVVFHAQIASEKGLFDFADIATASVDKMTRRHPHVFAEVVKLDSQQQTEAWESIKHKERKGQGLHSLLENIPLALPALKRAQKIQQRVAKVGFEWTELTPVVAKIHEELREVLDEFARPTAPAALEEEVGDLLFACANLARHLKIDPERALRVANDKFTHRFQAIEQQFHAQGRNLEQVSVAEMESAWQLVKTSEDKGVSTPAEKHNNH